ncbi:host-pathogen interaction-related protein [Trichosporon asahii var. asahii CBS 8904]|uniref:Host-pathogen interaction-related protein n=1 Tax=Trichosporon asahii var. asahii (strain CBS 8904) TaxID=1220162 RepID=K1VAG0_TRIAC|nr:host-pathogen interaction-related protein [Trichosporon asahii var. asahii CBS 8904]
MAKGRMDAKQNNGSDWPVVVHVAVRACARKSRGKQAQTQERKHVIIQEVRQVVDGGGGDVPEFEDRGPAEEFGRSSLIVVFHLFSCPRSTQLPLVMKRERAATLGASSRQAGSSEPSNYNRIADLKIGGAGSYGARLFLPPNRLGMIVDYTPESLPEEMKARLQAYGDMWDFRLRQDGEQTTRAVNKYKGQVREFEYLTPPSLLLPKDIVGSFGYPEWLHLVSFPDRAQETISQIQDIHAESGWSPGLLWEPEPPCCVPDNLELIKRLTPHVDVISPNHTEAMSLFNIPTPNNHGADANATLEWLVRRLLALKPRIGAVLRCGQNGCCYALSADLPPGTLTNDTLDAVPVYWGAPFHQSQDKVKDPTGAGNAFMGGLMAALYEGKDIHEGEWETKLN